jgi:hypothetical protein
MTEQERANSTPHPYPGNLILLACGLAAFVHFRI